MPLVPILPIFHRLNRQFFDSSLVKREEPLVAIRWSDGRLKRTAGFYRRFYGISGKKGCEIVLSRPVLENLPRSAIESTLCHEMIHAWIDLVLKIKEGHGPNFHARMDLINSTQGDFQISIRHNYPLPVKAPKWWAVCPLCKVRFPYQRKVAGAACKSCCDFHYGGRWNPGCLLEYQSVLKEG
tara:strand:- start:906 stop:1454 length:549 start_codon:yes stop_codon:yes gene_type:complete